MRLFVERARLARPGWTPSGPEHEAIADGCRRLDGIPLAIEMAAARTRAMPVGAIATRLDDAFRLLSGSGGGLVARHQTLRATLDWSWDLLDEDEKTLLARLAVFAGGWMLESAEEVCAGDGVEKWIVLDLLTGLIDKSLVVYEERGEAGRYRLLETVRQYAQERLAEGGESEAMAGRAAAWFLGLAEQAEPQLTGPEGATWLARLGMEHDNLRIALAWSLTDPAGVEMGLHLAGALENFWTIRGDMTESRQWLDRLLTGANEEDPTAAQAKALSSAGSMAFYQGDYSTARSFHERGLAAYRRLGDRQGIATVLNNLGNTAWAQGDYPTAKALHEEGLAISRALGDQQAVANAFNNLGVVAEVQGGHGAAKAM